MDFELRNDVTMDEYIHMITLKTSVLLACSLKLGAIVGGSIGDNADKLYAFGKNMGIAFQLMDDYLDAFGDSSVTGKQNGGDILANKKTFLLIKALENAKPAERTAIENLLASDSENKVPEMLSLYAATGSDKSCKNEVVRYSDNAFQCLEDVAMPSIRKEPLYALASYLLKREK